MAQAGSLTEYTEGLGITAALSGAGQQIAAPKKSKASTATVTESSTTVTLSLPIEVHAYFTEQAKQDERSLAKFLARKLKTVYDKEVASGRQ